MGLPGGKSKAAKLHAKADKALAKAGRTGNGSHLARAAELRGKARKNGG